MGGRGIKNGILYYDSQNENEPPSTLFISHPNGFVLDIKSWLLHY